ncbi:TNF receptor-associated factor 2 [Latimeria chalumnae]|uniref:TNF receptor-associated factor 2 n=1 Tax=Latimeria chalumnae TaxID=7897 RepID=UPI0003C0FFB6|nr:PREDICTED: TNF receptor-associated factor 2-like [Latimeria chalumnae]|eukprot:XP_006007250.1 PREDICTED: TNF receptor-associated factor 2-like [Latimeria chalumnae]
MVALVSGIRPAEQGVSAGLLCSACGYLLVQPRQTMCGHRYCVGCVDKLFRKSDQASCYVCEETLCRSQIYVDKAAEIDAFQTLIQCPESKNGCEWKGQLRNYLISHRDQCNYTPEACPNVTFGCKFVGAKCLLASHLSAECEWRVVACPHCTTSLPWTLLENHKESCPEQQKGRPLYVETGLPSNQLPRPAGSEKGDDSKSVAPCPFEKAGCQTKVEKETWEGHLEEAQQMHLKQLLSLTLGLESRVGEGEDKNAQFKRFVMEKLMAFAGLVSKGMAPKELEEKDHKESSCQGKIEKLEKTVCVLNGELAKCVSQVNTLRRKCAQYEQVLHDLQSQNQVPGRKGEGPKACQLASTDGVLIWKIKNFSSVLKAARLGQKTSYYSPAFSTHPFGYKLSCRVYPNGDGAGKGTHLSLFLAVMKGDYDEVLPWPFSQKVTFMVLDQVGGRHLTETFIPDALSSSFHKPRTPMNVASGSPQFVQHAQLSAPNSPYVQDNTLFIKVMVDTSGLPK